MSSSKGDHVVIIGAGVIGLQTALTVLTTPGKPHPTITILASNFPGSTSPHYTSPQAGGQWRTHATPTTPSGRQQCQWDITTYHHWKSLSSLLPTSTHGIGRVKSRYVWDEVNDEIAPSMVGENGSALGAGLWWRDEVDDFRILEPFERPEGTVFGVEWTSFCIDVPLYLRYLMAEVERHGGRCIQCTLPLDQGIGAVLDAATQELRKVRGITQKVDVFINATGLSAGKLVGDAKMYPVRGQTVLVKGEAKMARTRRGNGYIAYTIPRPGSGTTILGGSNEAGSWDEEVDDELNRLILERTQALAPELLVRSGPLKGKYEVLSRQVGFRPGREGGPRVEFEVVDGERVVLHCYGHGGAGYQNSVGCARTVSKMIHDMRRSQDASQNAVVKAKI